MRVLSPTGNRFANRVLPYHLMESRMHLAYASCLRALLRGGRAALAASVLLTLASPAAAEPALSCKRIPELIVHYLQKHIRFHYPNDELRQRVVDSYMRKLDPAKTLYLRSEADRLEKILKGVLLDLNDGDKAPKLPKAPNG